MTLRSSPLNVIIYAALVCISACGGSAGKNADKPVKDSSKKTEKKEDKKKEEKKEELIAKYHRPPIVNIVDTLAPKRLIIYCKDSAANFERIAPKLAKIYGTKLPAYIKKNSLKTAGAPMAWYKKLKAPYFFEAGIPVNKVGTKAVTGIQIRVLAAGKAIVAHFYGPFELLPDGYDAIREFMKDYKKVSAGAPYEMYVTDPLDKNGKPVDPYKVQTDIVFPIR